MMAPKKFFKLSSANWRGRTAGSVHTRDAGNWCLSQEHCVGWLSDKFALPPLKDAPNLGEEGAFL